MTGIMIIDSYVRELRSLGSCSSAYSVSRLRTQNDRCLFYVFMKFYCTNIKLDEIVWQSSCVHYPCYLVVSLLGSILVTARPKAWVCGSSLAGIVGCLPLVTVVWCQAEVSAQGRSPVQRSYTECVYH